MKKLFLILLLMSLSYLGFSQGYILTDTLVAYKYLYVRDSGQISTLKTSVANTANLNASNNINTNTLYGNTLHTDRMYMNNALTEYITIKKDLIFDTTQVKMYVYSKTFMPNLYWGKYIGNKTVTGLGGNIGIGVNNLSELTNGYGIVAIGYQAGEHVTSGNNSVYVGKWAGLLNKTGDYNVYIGSDAGVTDTSGKWNTFVGGAAGNCNKNGISNTFIGVDAGLNSNGNENTFIGAESGYSLTSGNNNIFIGNYAGYHVTNDNNLMLIGSGDVGNYANTFTKTAIVVKNMNTTEQDITLNGKVNISQVLKLTPLSTVPANPTEGDLFVNATDHHVYCYLNGMWRQLD